MSLVSMQKTSSLKTSSVSTVNAGYGADTTNYGLVATGGTVTEWTATKIGRAHV